MLLAILGKLHNPNMSVQQKCVLKQVTYYNHRHKKNYNKRGLCFFNFILTNNITEEAMPYLICAYGYNTIIIVLNCTLIYDLLTYSKNRGRATVSP